MNLDLTSPITDPNVHIETNKATFINGIAGFGGYARVTEHVELKEGDYAQASVGILLPINYPFGHRLWSERWITFDNWQQDEENTVRLALMSTRIGYLTIVSNRGSRTITPLAYGSVIPPVGVPFTLSMQVYFSYHMAYAAAFLDGRQVAVTTLPNIDEKTVIGRCRLGIDGASGATGQTAAFRNMRTEYSKRL